MERRQLTEAALTVARIIAEALIERWGNTAKIVGTAFKIVIGVMAPAT